MRLGFLLFVSTLVGPGILGVLFGTATPQAQAPPVDQITPEVFAPYVEVTRPGGAGTGSGTVIEVDKEVLVLTAAHVIDSYDEDSSEIFRGPKGKVVTKPNKKARPATIHKRYSGKSLSLVADVIWVSPKEEEGGNDLALLRPRDTKDLRPARLLLKQDLRLGESVWYIGTPAGQHARLEQSIVSVWAVRWRDRDWIGTNGCGWFGSSGGGLYVFRDGHYRLAGVTTRLAGRYEKDILMAKTPDDISNFIASYKEQKAKK